MSNRLFALLIHDHDVFIVCTLLIWVSKTHSLMQKLEEQPTYRPHSININPDSQPENSVSNFTTEINYAARLISCMLIRIHTECIWCVLRDLDFTVILLEINLAVRFQD